MFGSVAAKRRALPAVAALAAFTGLLVAAYANIVFLGETLVSTSNNHPFDYRFDRLRPGGVHPPAFLNWHDPGGAWWQWEPAAKFFGAALRLGRYPLWDPTVATGVDAHINLTQGQYFPPYMLLLLLGDTPAFRDLYYLLLLWTSGTCCFFLLLRRGLHPLSSLLFGTCYALGGALTFTVNSILGQPTALIPGLILALEALLARPSRPRMAILALGIAVFVLTSFLPVVISGLVLLGLRTLAELVPRRVDAREAAEESGEAGLPLRRTVLGFSSGALVLGLAMTAFLLLPMQLAAGRSETFQSWYSKTGLLHYGPDDLLTLVSPVVSYDVWQTQDPGKQLFPKPVWKAEFFYVGLVPLLLCCLASRPRIPGGRGFLLFFAGSAAILLLKLLGAPPVQWIGSLPGLNHVHFQPYFCGALGFAIGGLAALGAESLIRRPPSRGRIVLVAAVGVSVFLAVFLFSRRHGFNPQGDFGRYRLEVWRLLLLAALLLFVIWLRFRSRLSGPVTGAAIVILAALELVPMAFHRRFQRHDVWADVPDYVRFLQTNAGEARVYGAHDLCLTPNVFQGLGLRGISSRDIFNIPRYEALFRKDFGAASRPFLVGSRLIPDRRVLLDLVGVKYLVTFSPTAPEVEALESAGLVFAHGDGAFQIFRNPAAWPRAALASRYRLAGSPAEALDALGKVSSPDEVVLESRPTFSPAESGTVAGDCKIELDEGDEIGLETHARQPTMLVLIDSMAAGWSATVNGRRAPIFAANYAFRAVEVPAGRSIVRFRYRPPGYVAGASISAAALVISVGVLVWPRRAGPAGSTKARVSRLYR